MRRYVLLLIASCAPGETTPAPTVAARSVPSASVTVPLVLPSAPVTSSAAPIPVGPPYDMPAKILLGCFARSPRLGACITGMHFGNDRRFALTRVPLLRDVKVPKPEKLDVDGTGALSADDRVELAKTLAGFVAWSPTVTSKDDNMTVGNWDFLLFSLTYEKVPIRHLTAARNNGDKVMLLQGDATTSKTDVRIFAGGTADDVVVEIGDRIERAKQTSISITRCSVDGCDALPGP